MTTYWLTFRIEEYTYSGRSPQRRRDDLYEAIRTVSSEWWLEATSFVLFESASDIDSIAIQCDAAVSEHDLVLIRKLDAKEARLVGTFTDDSLTKLMPYLRR